MAKTDNKDLLRAGAAAIAEAVRAGEISAQAICDAAIARIERDDDKINAVPVRDFDEARETARQLDAAGVRGDARPLIGVPMTVKESNDVAGLPSTWGLTEFRNHIPNEDAVAVARLKQAGAVIVGKTNAPSALADWQSDNPVYGRTLNPLDPTRSPGGSSGGAAAALAAGMTPLEVGSDIGGSIRVPALFCGVFGHKPSWGVIPAKGHGYPGADSVETPLAVVGPMARNMRDLSLGFDVLAGPLDGSGYRLDLPTPRRDGLSGLRVLILENHPLATVDSSVGGAISDLADALDRLDVEISRDAAILPDLTAMHRAYVKMLNTVLSRSAPDAEPISAHAWMDLLDQQMLATRAWRAAFDHVDLVIAPGFGAPAFPLFEEADWRKRRLLIDGEETNFGAQLAFPGLATFPNLPATAAPLKRADGGLPVGVQIIGPPFGDLATLAFATALEREGLTAPPP